MSKKPQSFTPAFVPAVEAAPVVEAVVEAAPVVEAVVEAAPAPAPSRPKFVTSVGNAPVPKVTSVLVSEKTVAEMAAGKKAIAKYAAVVPQE